MDDESWAEPESKEDELFNQKIDEQYDAQF